jgi:hypothetical protein
LRRRNNTMESVVRLRELHDDLIAFSEGRLANIERLAQELEDSIQDFQKLLEKSKQDPVSRDTLGKGWPPRIWNGERLANLDSQAK